MKPCPDCKATPGTYIGLNIRETCPTCDGTTLVPEEKQAPAPKPFDPSDYLGELCMQAPACRGGFYRVLGCDCGNPPRHCTCTPAGWCEIACSDCGEPPPEYLQHEQVRFTVGFPPQSGLSNVGPMWFQTSGYDEPWHGPDNWNVFADALDEYATPGPTPTGELPLVHLETVEEFRAFAAHFKIEIVE